MPQVTVYIRSEDIDKWKSIERKSEFMHKALGPIRVLATYGEYKLNQLAKEDNLPTLKIVEKTFKSIPPGPDGYPCCIKNKPCKHWHFDDINQVWVNEITNKEREV